MAAKDAQFTYDFGVAISQSVIGRVTKLVGASLTLASAFYALKNSSKEYEDTLRTTSMRFGGYLNTMNLMAQAQERLIKGQSNFSVSDQIKAMDLLASSGLNVQRELDFIDKAAHATGQSISDLAGKIHAGIGGNMSGLVEMGLLTQRSADSMMRYYRYPLDRQKAIMKLLKENRTLQKMIENDFKSMSSAMKRFTGIWKAFAQAIVGKPNDPDSLYGNIVATVHKISDAMAANGATIKQWAYAIQQILSWTVRTVGKFITWLGGQLKRVMEAIWGTTDNFVCQVRKMVVVLEFWRLKFVDIFKPLGEMFFGALIWIINNVMKPVMKWLVKHEKIVWGVVKAYIALKAAMWLDTKARAMVLGIRAIGKAWMWNIAVLKRYRRMHMINAKYLGEFGKVGKMFNAKIFLKSFGALLPKGLRRFLFRIGKYASGLGKGIGKSFMFLGGGLKRLPRLLGTIGKGVVGFFGKFGKFAKFAGGFLKRLPRLLMTGIKAVPVIGWIIAIIDLIVILYKKFEGVRKVVNSAIALLIEWWKFLWNIINVVVVYAQVAAKKIWQGIKYIWGQLKRFFSWIWDGVTYIWNQVKAFGSWIWGGITYVWDKLSGFFEWVGNAFTNMWNAFMDTRLGNFVNNTLIKPLKSFFTWLQKIFDAIWGFLKKVGDWFKNAWQWIKGKFSWGGVKSVNDAVSGHAASVAERHNVRSFGIAGGVGTDNLYGSGEDYLKFNRNSGNMVETAPEPSNLLLAPAGAPDSSFDDFGDFGGFGGTTMNVHPGAIVIQTGNVNEQELARQIKKVLLDIERESNVRGGR